VKKLVIAVDGPGAAGKSTVSKALAARLGYLYIDTGALSRAVAWIADHEGLADAAPALIGARVGKADIRLEGDPQRPRVLVDARDVSDQIRSERISQLSSKLSAFPEVRGALLDLQRRLGADGGVVMDGRDIGTVIFPAAEAKFFISASPEVRARRRHAELMAKGIDADLDLVSAELEERDRRDAGREHAPLKAADDAVAIDTTGLDPAAVLDKMLAVVETRHKEPA
jgi:cytidylate kinase